MINGLIHINTTFDKVISINKKVNNREFEGCVFKNCDFSAGDFSNNIFIDCQFYDCNLSMINLRGTGLKTVDFINCKLLGILFNECDDFLFNVSFDECVIDYASFANKKMLKTKFINSSLKEVSYIETDLSGSIFENSNLDGAIFNKTKLTAVDFTLAQNFKIDPEFNPMRKAKFSSLGIIGLLDKYDIKIE